MIRPRRSQLIRITIAPKKNAATTEARLGPGLTEDA